VSEREWLEGLRYEDKFPDAQERLRELRHRADSGQIIGLDISDYSDEFCAGFLAGQSHALDLAMSAVSFQEQSPASEPA
jgi:hypothetical protein